MPKQHVLFGRLLPPITTRRITILLCAVFTFALFSVLYTLPSAVPTGPSLSKFADHKFSMPQLKSSPTWPNAWTGSLNPFRPKSHAPPRQDGDSHEDSAWFADWKWLSTPFSSSFTLDETRALLPPLPPRPPIYCYYDAITPRDKAIRDAESALLLTWRRAWWAQGFRPILLSSAEALNNPRYNELQHLKVTPGAKEDIMRWLAWENMGGGLLAQYLVLPMGPYDDPQISFLRRGEYPTLTRWEGFGDGLFAGSKADISGAISLVLANPVLVNAETFLEALPAVGAGAVPVKAAAPAASAVASKAAPAVAAASVAPKDAAGAADLGAASPVGEAAPVKAAAGQAAPGKAAAVQAAASGDARTIAAPAEAAPANAAPAKVAARAAEEAQGLGASTAPGTTAEDDDHGDIKKKTKDYPFVVDETPTALAFYDAQVIAMKYTKVGDHITRDRAGGLLSLNELINAHLQVVWQNLFSNGIAVLKPRAIHSTRLVERGLQLANRLAQCSVTPLEASCPPNLPKCEPCVARQPMRIHTPPTFRNTSALFTIGTVPHPFTYQSVVFRQGPMDVPWLRRESTRDAWLYDITKELLGTGVSGISRVLQFKRAVAGEYGSAHSLWITAEQPMPDDVEWWFGFSVPRLGEGIKKGESTTPVPGPERLPPPKHDKDDGPVATVEALAQEAELLKRVEKIGLSTARKDKALREAVEAWNLADTEAWKFARAYLARAFVERAAWEAEEAKFSGGAGSEKGSSW